MATQNHLSLEEPSAEQNPNFFIEEPNDTMQDNTLDDESDETVSLCDLPIYGCHSVCSTSDTMKGDESFEFFSEEWVRNDKDSSFFPQKDIIFCGNLILPKQKQPISRNSHEFKKQVHGSSKVDQRSGAEFAKLRSMNKGRNHGGRQPETKTVFPAKKSRWYYYGVGLAGIPAEMDLSAIKNRQNERQKKGSQGGGRKESYGKGLSLSRLVRDLSCNGQTQANSMVKASLVCIPRV